jgi:cardiolipin synthase
MDHHVTHSNRSAKQRVALVAAIFLLFQAIVAVLVTLRAKRRLSLIASRRADDYAWRSFEEIELERGDDHIKLYMHGRELVDDIVEAIDGAREQVCAETFIWVDDETGRSIRDALGRAAERGIEVWVLYDWLLSSRLPRDWFHPAINLMVFKELHASPSALRPKNLLRDHRKLIVVDDETAFIGGYNFGDEYIGWRDSHVRLSGRSVGDLHNAFADFWNGQRSLHTRRIDSRNGRSWDPHISVHRNDPSLAIFPIRGMYLEALDRAEKNVWITNAYFVPDRAFRASLVDASRRGVDVRIILPENSNHPLTDVLAHGTFDDLLTCGVRIFLYRDFMVHAKTATIDGQWSTVGTANLDRWSMLGNYEINLEVRSKAFASQMEAMFLLDMESCAEVEIDVWRRRPTRFKMREATLRSLAPLM